MKTKLLIFIITFLSFTSCMDGTDPEEVKLDVKTNEGGVVLVEGGLVVNGIATLHAKSEKGKYFYGWYKDEVLISQDSIYNFSLKKTQESIYAEFDDQINAYRISLKAIGLEKDKDEITGIKWIKKGESWSYIAAWNGGGRMQFDFWGKPIIGSMDYSWTSKSQKLEITPTQDELYHCVYYWRD